MFTAEYTKIAYLVSLKIYKKKCLKYSQAIKNTSVKILMLLQYY